MAEMCPHCEEAIEPFDITILVNTEKFHNECLFRMTMGSVGHLRRTCCCYGGTEEDPPGMTRRQSARAAFNYFNRRRGIRVGGMLRSLN
jgi:hypothetical protein